MTNHKGRCRAPRKSRTPILAVLLILGLAAVGCVAGAEADSPGYTSTSVDGYDSEPEPASEPEPLSDEEITRLAIEMTFDEASAADMADMCDGVALFGMETAIAFYAEGFGPDWKPSYGPMVEAELRDRC